MTNQRIGESANQRINIGAAYTDRPLTEAEVHDLAAEALAQADLAGKRVLVIIPDGTRTAPVPLLFRLLRELLGEQVAALDYLVALGTHPPMDDAALGRLVGVPVRGRLGLRVSSTTAGTSPRPSSR
jgi:nickel-dependent lactate racemase